jgi:Tfp pilus assembly protein PilO
VKGARDKTIFIVLGIAALLFLFYFAVLGPKREKASALGDDITQLESSIEQQKQVTQFAEDAREQFPRDYGQLVGLGKAVPEQADQASMLVQVNSLANRAGVDFRGFELAQAGGSAEGGSTAGSAAPTPAPGTEGTTPPPGESAPPAEGDTGATPASTTAAPAPATESVAANLPIGAVVGPAGLPTLPYDVTMAGSFFGVANFMGGVDRLVVVRGENGLISANGRLVTMDGFALHHPTQGAVPQLEVDFSLTSYVVPAEQGLTAGATPGGPAPAPTVPEATPTSATGVAP